MATLKLAQFLGERPGRHPHKLQGQEAQVARNLRIFSQALEPFRGRDQAAVLDSVVAPRTIFRDRNNLWLEFAERTHVVNTIVGNDPYDRVFYSLAAGGLRVSDNTRRTTGVGPFPGASLTLGVPAPTTAPVATVTDIGDAVDPDTAVDNELVSRVYAVTFVNSYGEEGPPSTASNVVSVYPGATVSVSLPSPPAGDYDFTLYYLYRFVDGAYQFVGTAPIAATSLNDTLPIDLAQEPLESVSWNPPPATAKGLISMAGSFLAAFRGNQILMSEEFLPHAWPTEYRQSIDYDIVGLGTYGNTLVVCTKGPVYVGMGSTPSALIVSETSINEACVAEESIVSMAGGVCYASPNGLVFVGDRGISVATSTVMTEKEWKDLNPSSIRATSWNSLYVASYQKVGGEIGAFMFDPQLPDAGIFWLDLPRASALYTHVESDKMYMVDVSGTTIQQWIGNEATTFAPFVWRSRPFELTAPAPINVAQVKADGYPVTFRVYADGVLQATHTVASIQPFRVGGGYLARNYAFEVEGTERVYELTAATAMVEVRTGQ